MTVKERIIQEATELFFQRGVRNVTMNDLAIHLGMSKRTIYENVKDKDELLVECLDNFERQEDCKLESAAQNMRIMDVLKMIIEESMSTRNSDLANFIMEVKRYHPKVFENNVERYQQKRFDQTCDFLERGISEGFYKPDTDVKISALIITNMFSSLDRFLSLDFGKQQLQLLFRTMLITFCRGMATLEGVKEIDKSFSKNIL